MIIFWGLNPFITSPLFFIIFLDYFSFIQALQPPYRTHVKAQPHWGIEP